MRHEVIYESRDLPYGYDSYSLLLIPDGEWLRKAGAHDVYRLFVRFKEFGDTIGPRHLAAWPYRAMTSRPLVDTEIFSLVYAIAKSADEVNSLFNKDKVHGGTYDIARAKCFCARYNLNFAGGPYIAFFEKRPDLAYVPTLPNDPDRGKVYGNSSPPDFLLRFNGIAMDEIVRLLSELEFEILRPVKNVRHVEWSQFKTRLAAWVEPVAGVIGRSVQLVNRAKEVAPSSGTTLGIEGLSGPPATTTIPVTAPPIPAATQSLFDNRSLRLLISFSPEDHKLKEQLVRHLQVLVRFAGIDLWTADRVLAGGSWREEVDAALDRADVALLLISADFLASDFLQDVEVPKIFQRREQRGLKVIPVLARSCHWQAHPWLGTLKPLPTGMQAIASLQEDNRDRALTEVVAAIEQCAGAVRSASP